MQIPITAIEGVGEKIVKLFAKIGVYTTDDLLHLYPRRYETYEYPKFIFELTPGNIEAVWFFVTNRVYERTHGTLSVSQTVLNDGTGKIKLVWYHMPWISKVLKQGHDYVFYGKVQQTDYGLIMEQPRFYTVQEYEMLQKYIKDSEALWSGHTDQLPVCSLGATIGTHVGPGAIAVAFFSPQS